MSAAPSQSALEGLATEDETWHRALVDDRSANRTGESLSPVDHRGVDESDPTGVTVDNLPAREVDRIVGGQF